MNTRLEKNHIVVNHSQISTVRYKSPVLDLLGVNRALLDGDRCGTATSTVFVSGDDSPRRKVSVFGGKMPLLPLDGLFLS
jgi:hypothetical protein